MSLSNPQRMTHMIALSFLLVPSFCWHFGESASEAGFPYRAVPDICNPSSLEGPLQLHILEQEVALPLVGISSCLTEARLAHICQPHPFKRLNHSFPKCAIFPSFESTDLLHICLQTQLLGLQALYRQVLLLGSVSFLLLFCLPVKCGMWVQHSIKRNK